MTLIYKIVKSLYDDNDNDNDDDDNDDDDNNNNNSNNNTNEHHQLGTSHQQRKVVLLSREPFKLINILPYTLFCEA